MSQQTQQQQSRRSFLRNTFAGVTALSVYHLATGGLLGCSTGAGGTSAALLPPTASDSSEPKNISYSAVLTAKGEPGEPMLVSGRIYAPDGKTPVEGVTLHVYHTDARGLYSEADGKGGPPDPRIKGWVRTNKEGFYEFRSIKPASYPNSRNPQHIHAKVYGAGYAERWIPEYWFDDDPLIDAATREKHKGLASFSPVMKVTRGSDGLVRCVRDIRLERT